MYGEDLGIGDLSIGVSKAGMQSYIDNLSDQIFNRTGRDLTDGYSYLESVISDGWQGVSRDNFIKDFKENLNQIIKNIDVQKKNFETELTTLMNNYFNIDSIVYDNYEG